MHMALKTRRWTRADLRHLPDDGNRYEVIEGTLLVSPAPTPSHEQVILALADQLDAYARAQGIGRAWHGNSAFAVRASQAIPDIVVRPHVVPPPADWIAAPMPSLVVEVLSDATRGRDLVMKRGFYLENGVPEYWIVDPAARSIERATRSGSAGASDSISWQPPGAAAPLVIAVAELFRSALG